MRLESETNQILIIHFNKYICHAESDYHLITVGRVSKNLRKCYRSKDLKCLKCEKKTAK
jgi:hypothetical protein